MAKAKAKASVESIVITRTKSGIGAKQNHRDTLRTLGLRKIGDSVVRPNDAVTQGMVRTVAHMVEVQEAK